MKDKEMQEHLIKILNRFSMRTDLVNELFIDVDDYRFRSDVSEEDMWSYYILVCKELKIRDRIIRSHGMDSGKAYNKKIGGHTEETLFEKYGLQTQSGTNKTDLLKNGKPYASLKGGVKIQWGMHVITNLPKNLKELFSLWISTFEKDSLYYRRLEFGNKIVSQLNNKNLRRSLINFYFRKNEEIPFLIIKDVNIGIYYRIKYLDLIDLLVENLDFYVTKDKVKVVGRMDLGENKKMVIFEIEPRSDKDNYILMHGLSNRVIRIIKKYKIHVEEIY